MISNVGGTGTPEAMRTALARVWAVGPEFVKSAAQAAGIRCGYADPAKLGVDRWVALIGARSLERGPLCVASIGTAATIDGVDADGRHLGGVIVPGPDLMVASLLRNTSDIAARAEQGSRKSGLFADNTLGAVVQGAEHALAALIERAVDTMKRELAATPTLLLTGGASPKVESAIGVPHRVIPDLVLRGVAVLSSHRQG